MIRRGVFNREREPGSVTRRAIGRFAVDSAHDAGVFCVYLLQSPIGGLPESR